MKHLLKSVFIKVESTYGVSAAPTTSDVLLAENVEIDPLTMQTDDYTAVSNKFGSFEKIVGAVWCTARFDVVVGGGGTPVGAVGGVPNHDSVLRAAAMARVITPTERIVYSPIDSGEESATILYYVDSALFGLLGLRGDLEWIFEAGKAPRMRFTGLALRVPMQDLGASSYTLPTKPRPVAMTKANSLVQLNTTFNARCSSMTLKLGNQIEYVNRSGQEEVILADRTSSGSMTFELPAVSTRDLLGPNGWCTLATQISMAVEFGGALSPGNRVGWYADTIQLLNPRLSGDKGTSMITCDIHIVKNDLRVVYF